MFLKGNLERRKIWSWECDEEWVRLITELATAQILLLGLCFQISVILKTCS